MKITFTILFTLLIGGFLKAQTEYTLTHSTGTYTELSTSTNINKVWDFEDAMIKLPFKFKYFKKDFDTIYVTMQSAFFSRPGLNYDNIFYGSFNYFPEDEDPNLSPVSYAITGTSPNRILKVQFKNVKAEVIDIGEEFTANYQMWFHETSNKFQFHFGPNVNTDLNLNEHIMGFIDVDNSPYLAISGTASEPTLVRVTSAASFKGISTHPSNGQIYTFNPEAPSTSTQTIIKPYTLTYNENGMLINSSLNIEIEILDLNGKLIAIQKNDNTNSYFVNTNLLQSGLYIVRIKAEDESFNEKLVVY
jgi:hypothetical protein